MATLWILALHVTLAWFARRFGIRGIEDGDHCYAYGCEAPGCGRWEGPVPERQRDASSKCHPGSGTKLAVVVLASCLDCGVRLCYRAAAPRQAVRHLAGGQHDPAPLFVPDQG